MTFKLTERDKRLLYIMAFILLAFLLVYFGIMPEADRAASLLDEQAQAQQLLAEQQTKLATVPQKEALKAQLEAQLAEATAGLYPFTPSDRVDDLVTGLLLSHNMTPRALDIQQGAAQTVAPYPFSAYRAERLEAALEAAGDGGDGGIPGEAALSVALPGSLSVVGVSCTALGSQADLMALLDTLDAQYPAIGVRGFSISRVQEKDPDSETGLRERTELAFSLELYCYDPPEEVAP